MDFSCQVVFLKPNLSEFNEHRILHVPGFWANHAIGYPLAFVPDLNVVCPSINHEAKARENGEGPWGFATPDSNKEG